MEILSPSNTYPEMLGKVLVYLEAGALEVWLFNESGGLEIPSLGGQLAGSIQVTGIADKIREFVEVDRVISANCESFVKAPCVVPRGWKPSRHP